MLSQSSPAWPGTVIEFCGCRSTLDAILVAAFNPATNGGSQQRVVIRDVPDRSARHWRNPMVIDLKVKVDGKDWMKILTLIVLLLTH